MQFSISKISVFIIFICMCCFVFADKTYKPDIEVMVTSVYDGDTFYCDIDGIHPVFGKKISVRVRGIDSPEMHSKNESTKIEAEKSKKFAVNILNKRKVTLKNLGRDKYFRILADVYVDGESFADKMLEAKLAKKYDGGKKN